MRSHLTRLLLAAASLLTAYSPVFAQAAPRLLFASPDVQGANAHAVLITLPAGGGHAGLILNKARDAKLSDILPDDPNAAKVTSTLGHGGNLGKKIVFALTSRDPGEGSKQLAHGLYMATGSETVARTIATMPNEARFFTTMTASLPGELDSHLAAREWIVAHQVNTLICH